MSNYRRRNLILNPTQKKLLAAQKVRKKIRATDYGAFQDVGCVEWLVFPGFSWTPVGHRPPREFFFSAREAYIKAFRAVVEDEDNYRRGVVILGPKGSGKSCILRALAVELIGRGLQNYRVLCIWYLDARSDVAQQVRDALLFAFCESGPDTADQIEAIGTVARLSSFLQARKDAGDIIILVSDGEERYDIEHRDGQKRTHEEATRRMAAKSWLDTLEKYSCRIIKTLSPDANVVPDSMKPFLVDDKLGKAEYEAFLAGNCSLLARMLGRHGFRQAEVRLYAGFHPMSLFLLNKACEDYVNLTAGNPSRKRKALHLGVLDPRTNEVIEEEPEAAEPEAEVECYLDDDEDWQRVLVNFRKAEPFQAIRRFVMDYRGDVELLRTPGSVLEAYVDANGSFCTDFLHTVHMRACLERVKTHIYRAPTFVSYLRSKLAKPNVTWPEVGWSLEGFIADAIMALGLKLPWGKLVPSQVEPLNGEPKQLDPESWEVDKKIFLLPGKCSFNYVDGLIVWMDKDGVVHVLAIQDTVSPETHRKTEYRFMEREEIARWYCGARTVRWYYVYLCPSRTGSKLAFESTGKQRSCPSGESKPGPPLLDMVEYERHELQLSECFGANLGQDELDLLKQLAKVRDKEVERRKKARRQGQQKYDELLRSLPREKQQLLKEAKRHARPRKWLEAEAMKRGIQDPGNKAYKHMYVLLEAMPLAD